MWPSFCLRNVKRAPRVAIDNKLKVNSPSPRIFKNFAASPCPRWRWSTSGYQMVQRWCYKGRAHPVETTLVFLQFGDSDKYAELCVCVSSPVCFQTCLANVGISKLSWSGRRCTKDCGEWEMFEDYKTWRTNGKRLWFWRRDRMCYLWLPLSYTMVLTTPNCLNVLGSPSVGDSKVFILLTSPNERGIQRLPLAWTLCRVVDPCYLLRLERFYADQVGCYWVTPRD